MATVSLRSAFLWIAYFAFCLSLIWAFETFSKARGSENLAICFFYMTDACERLTSTSTSAYPPFRPVLTWIMLLGLIGILIMSLVPRGGDRQPKAA
jgi:hypothetical protein